MIFRLEYCNKDGVATRVDIETPGSSTVQAIEGTGDPFILKYTGDKPDKSLRFFTSSAEINIYETPLFNIDTLKTSSETDIKVKQYINGNLNWTGFVIPDFFSREIGGDSVVKMIASDRISTLKGVTLEDLPATLTLRDIVIRCLQKTGLDLTVKTMADFNWDQQGNGFFRSRVWSQRFFDNKSRSVSCYDILGSILTASHGRLQQHAGEWYIINKYQHETGVGRLYSSESQYDEWVKDIVNFSEITKGAEQSIVAVAANVGVYNEYGGGQTYPENNDFSKNETGSSVVSDWTPVGGFVSLIDDRSIRSYNSQGDINFGSATNKKYLINNNSFSSGKYLESTAVLLPFDGGNISIKIEVSAIGPAGYPDPGKLRFSILAVKGDKIQYMNDSGGFQSDSHRIEKEFTKTGRPSSSGTRGIHTLSIEIEGNLQTDGGDSIIVRIYGSNTEDGGKRITAINYASFSFGEVSGSAMGTVYKTIQGSGGFTRSTDTETTIFGDYLSTGLNGYMYEYPIDDTSIIHNSDFGLTSEWIATDQADQLPLLQHVTRQMAYIFSVAHDMISGEIDITSFNPLSIFQDCNGVQYVVVSAEFDFLRSKANLQLEEIAYANNSKRDYIYSYFGEGDDGIKSLGGIASGSGGGTGGGGMTPEQLLTLNNLASWWKLDEENDAIYSEKSVYSLKGVSALGLGSGGGGGGGGDIDMLDSWANYTTAKANYYAPASLLVPFRNDTLNRLTSLESGSATSIVTTGTGNAITSLTKSGSVITANKGLTFALASHTHTIAQITGLQGALDLKASQSDITTAIDGIEIGGRNYVSNASIVNMHLSPSGGNIQRDVKGYSVLLSVNGGDTFTLTKQNNNGARFRVAEFYSSDIPTVGDSFDKYADFGIDTTAGTFTLNSATNWLLVQLSYSGLQALLDDYVKLEKGNKATDWTPAPEDQVDLNTAQTITGAKTFSALLTASAGVNTPKVDFGNGFTIEPSGTELVFKYNGAIKQRMLSDGTILATGGVTALST